MINWRRSSSRKLLIGSMASSCMSSYRREGIREKSPPLSLSLYFLLQAENTNLLNILSSSEHLDVFTCYELTPCTRRPITWYVWACSPSNKVQLKYRSFISRKDESPKAHQTNKLHVTFTQLTSILASWTSRNY